MVILPQVALVTGSSQGIGRGIALGLAESGWDVVVNYRSHREGAEDTAAAIRELGRRCWVHQADVGDSAQVRSLFSEIQEEAGGLRTVRGKLSLRLHDTAGLYIPEDVVVPIGRIADVLAPYTKAGWAFAVLAPAD